MLETSDVNLTSMVPVSSQSGLLNEMREMETLQHSAMCYVISFALFFHN